jgi:hypothetical protein
VAVNLHDKMVMLSVDLTLKDKAYDRILEGANFVMMALRGQADLAGNRSRIHDLAAATQRYLKAKKHFPRGTAQRAAGAERGLEWRPDQRLSWMVVLLPYLGNGDWAGLHVNPDMSWNEAPNDQIARVVLPPFLAQGKTDLEHRYIHYPTLAKPFAPTHFVGMAGVGLDAASYAANDPATAGKRGIFGYDRVTRPEDIKDGLAKTILLIQVPADHKSPWMAGGGSTVRGVSEDDDCVGPFVCSEYEGKKGTFAIMADGKVRFIPATIDPKVFRALCTIAGGEPIGNLEGVAKEVPNPNEDAPELRTSPALAAAGQEAPAASGKFPAGWKEHVSKEGGFAVALPPGTLHSETQSVKVPGVGDLVIQIMGVERAGDKASFAVLYNDYPQAVMNGGPDAILNGAKTEMMALLPNAKVSSESKISLEGNTCREFTVAVPGRGDGHARIFLVKNRMYRLLIGGPKPVDAKDVKAFFDSFRLLK